MKDKRIRKGRGFKRLWLVKDMNGKVLFADAKTSEVKEFLGVWQPSIYARINTNKDSKTMVTSKKDGKKYILQGFHENETEKPKKVEKPKLVKPKRISKREKWIKFIKNHLDIYGNTLMYKDPTDYCKTIEERHGYSIRIEERPRHKVFVSVPASQSKSKKDNSMEWFPKSWYIELISKPDFDPELEGKEELIG